MVGGQEIVESTSQDSTSLYVKQGTPAVRLRPPSHAVQRVRHYMRHHSLRSCYSLCVRRHVVFVRH